MLFESGGTVSLLQWLQLDLQSFSDDGYNTEWFILQY